MTRTSTKRTAKLKPQLDQPDLGPVEQVSIDLLKPYPGNARTHSDKQLATIVRSLESFGWMNPLIAERDGTIIAGHGRWLAARQLGLARCPVIRAEHLTPDAARAYRLADNRIAELSDWDRDTLEMALSNQRGRRLRGWYRWLMSRKSRALPPSPFRRFNSSPEVIRLVVLMYVRFPLSLRNVEDLLFERGIDICHETVRLWWNRFGPLFAGDIRRQRVSRMRGFRHWRWHLDEMYVKLNGEMVYLWRAVDHEGEVLESYVTRARDKAAALRFMKKALKRHGSPNTITTDGLRSYGAAMDELGCRDRQEIGRWANNRVENSHLPFRRRERAMLRFRQMKTLQKFASVHANVHNHFSLERHLIDRQTYRERRSAALAEWQVLAS